ncbi:hypothetical protein AAFN60_18140 [Roseibacillus persicicus]|uniref:hypothetical protein n=1 Tax=Roseibacillus persicicus TaxID=454148 RepID=UPI00398B4252
MRRVVEVTLFIVCIAGGAMAYLISRKSNEPEAGEWHFDGIVEVRAYRTNWDDEYSSDVILTEDNQLNATRIPEMGIVLTGEQVERLKQAVCVEHPPHPVAACFNPHHAFTFHNENGAIIGHIDLCFQCSNYYASPKGFSSSWSLGSLEALLRELGIPLENPDWG